MHSSEAAESIVKLSLEGFEVAARITGKGAEKRTGHRICKRK